MSPSAIRNMNRMIRAGTMFADGIGGNWHEMFGFVSPSDTSIMRISAFENSRRAAGLEVLGLETDDERATREATRKAAPPKQWGRQ